MRVTALLLILSLLFTSAPGPALALSTAKEIAQGESLNRDVDRQSVIVTDPFLTSWVNRTGERLAKYRARTDITYHFETINSDDINSFALPGGFIHVYMGLLNFAASDDELASVLGHEMGHIERRHMYTLNTKANILSIIIGVLSILSPLARIFGGLGGDLAITKFSRQDELQADQYGLLLMSRAGFDPQADVDLMAHLVRLSKNGPAESNADRAFADHPLPKDRIAHMLGYSELDNPTVDQQLARAIHDENEGMYAYAEAKLKDVLKRRASDRIAQEHLAAAGVALAQPGARQLDGLMAGAGASDTSSMTAIAGDLAAAANISKDDLDVAKEQAKSGRPELESFFNRLQSLTSTVPNFPDPNKNAKNLKTAVDGLDRLVRDVNGVLGYASDTLSTGPGFIVDNRATLRDLASRIDDGRPTPKTRALLVYYPTLTVQLTRSSDDVVRGMNRARAAVAMGSDAAHVLADFFNAANVIKMDKTGDISAADWPQVQAALNKALDAWDRVSAMAASGSDFVYAAQTRGLSTQLTLLDLLSSRQRYAAFQRALAYRFPGVATPDYGSIVDQGITPGELGCAAWLSFETKRPVSSVIQQSRTSDTACPDLALQHHLMAESMEIAVGLLYSGYTSKPQTVK
jgi:Zn-dependent protease with chaperone function